MSVKHTIKLDKTQKLQSELSNLNGKSIEVGVFNGEQAWLAHIHEFGCVIQVTPKMRNYLAATGLHLKKTTTVITIPERSFLRTGYDVNRDEVLKTQDILMGSVADGTIDVKTFLDMVGTELESKIKEYAVDLQSPALHPYTLEHRKHGGSNPLADTGDMIGSISHRIV